MCLCRLLDVSRESSYGLFLVQAEDGIRDLVRSRGLGDVYKRQPLNIMTRTKSGLFVLMRTLVFTVIIPAQNHRRVLLSLIHI